MKARELKNILTYVSDNDDVEFIVNNDKNKGLMHAADPVRAQIKTEWEVPKRGDPNVTPDELPQTLIIFLETHEAA